VKTLRRVRAQLGDGSFDFTRHALRRVVERNISDDEIKEAGRKATIIENYPDDK